MATPLTTPNLATPPDPTPASSAISAPEITISNTPEQIAAAIAAPTPKAPPEAPATPPPSNEPYTIATLENGQLEVKLASGERFVGSQDDVIRTLAKSKWDTNQYVNQLKQQVATPAPIPPAPAAPEYDPAAEVIADMLAPYLGAANGKALRESLARQQAVTEQYEGQLVAQQFYSSVPDFPTSPANSAKLIEYIEQNGLQYTPSHMRMAHLALKADGQYEQVNRPPAGAAAPRPGPNPPPPNSSASQSTSAVDPYTMPLADLGAMIKGMR